MRKLSIVLALALLLPASAAFAEGTTEIKVDAQAGVTATKGGEVSESSEGSLRVTAIGVKSDDEASTSVTKRGNDDNERGALGTTTKEERENASTTDDSNDDKSMAEEHRSVVATFVKSLLEDADRDGGIGEEVRAVAQSQNDNASTTAEAIAKVEGRNALLSFFLGEDWKSVGTLRSQVAKGAADVSRLEDALAKTTDVSVKADLQAQITAITAEHAKIQAFVEDHTSRFSLFGWFTKLFAGSTD